MDIEKSPTASALTEKFVVRLPKGMRAQIAEVSKLSRRSMNSEIVARLEHSLAAHPIIAITPNMIAENTPGYVAESIEAVGEMDDMLLRYFQRLSVDKKKALVEFLT